jgi:acetyl esterase/lipase
MVKRVIAIILLVAATAGIWHHADLIAKRTSFAMKQTDGSDAEYVESDSEVELEKEFHSREPDLDALIGESGMASDSEFMNSVAKLFTDLYGFLKDIIKEGGEVNDVDSAQKQFIDIFNGLFSLDEKLYEKNPKLMGELTNKGFVTAAISIVWDLVTYYDNNRVNSQTMQEGVTRIEDVPYIDDGKNEHMLDIYYPDNTEGNLPVIIDIHGGGLMMGDKDSNRVYCSILASRGYTVIAVNYRLAPDVLYESMVQDIMAAFRWVNDNGAEYHCDLDNVFVTGDSAGGNLAYYVPLVNTSEKLQSLFEVEASGLNIRALGIVSGMFDMKNGFNAPLISCYLGFEFKNKPYYEYLQPEEALPYGELPPAYFVTSQRDFLHASGVYFDGVLTEMGIEHQFRDWGMSINRSSGHITSVAYPELEESQKTIDEMLEFFEAHKSVTQEEQQ